MGNQGANSQSFGQLRRLSFWFAMIALACVFVADLAVVNTNPWLELTNMGRGFLAPKLVSWVELFDSIAITLAFAIEGMVLAVLAGFIFALAYGRWWVRLFCALLRSVHELFWALIFIQIFGLSPLTGVLALAIPYAGTIAKIYGELFEESKPAPRSVLLQPQKLSAFFYTTIPLCWAPMITYTSYRLECAIRSSIVLGFIGLPTLGYHLESTLREGLYAEAVVFLYALILLIVSLRFILRKQLLGLYVLLAFWYLPPSATINLEFVLRFFTVDIIPSPLIHGWQQNTARELGQWFIPIYQQQLWPGLSNTLILSQISLVTTAVLTLLVFPLNSVHFYRRSTRVVGDALLIILRSIPEFILAFIALLFTGPSMLPGIIALSIHNSGILAHLLGRFSENIKLREDACTGVNRYGYEILPRLYRHFLALLLYRWEIIMRESAILGILGIATLGFYIDSAFEEFRFDRAALLILTSALLNVGVDSFSRYLRHRLHLSTTPETI